VLELGPGVLQKFLLLTRAAQDVRLSLQRGGSLPCEGERAIGSPLDRLRPWDLHLLGASAELLDAPPHLAAVRLRLPPVLLQALLVRRATCHPDVRLERGLELLLLAVCLVQILDQLDVAGLEVWHLHNSLPVCAFVRSGLSPADHSAQVSVSWRSYGPSPVRHTAPHR